MKIDSLAKVLNIIVSTKGTTEAELLHRPEHDLKSPEMTTLIELLEKQGLVFTFHDAGTTFVMPTNEGFKYIEHCRGNHL